MTTKYLLIPALLIFSLVVSAQKSAVSSSSMGSDINNRAARLAQLEEGAVVPRMMKFSGSARDAQGQTRSGVTGILFSIYAEPTDGAALWSETQSVELDAQGHYTVLLGSNHDRGLPRDIFNSGEARWLGVQVLGNGEAEQARTLLVSVPYAMKSGDAETLGGRPASAYMLANPQAVANNAPGASVASVNASGAAASKSGRQRFCANGAPGCTNPASTLNGTANQVAKFSGVAGELVNSAIFESGGKVGINKTNPLQTLDVNGNMNVQVNASQAVDTTTDAAIFTNNLSPSVDQPTGTQQGFVGNIFTSTSRNLSNVFGSNAFVTDIGSGTRQQVAAQVSEAYNDGTATVGQMAGTNGYAENSGKVTNLAALRAGNSTFGSGLGSTNATLTFSGGKTTNAYGVWVQPNGIDVGLGSAITNNYGVKIDDQAGVGTNNWSLRTGSGLVQFGDRTLLAASTTTGSSLNIPSGVAPTTPVAGDLWSTGGSLLFFNGATKTVAFSDLSNLSGTITAAQGGTGANNTATLNRYLKGSGATFVTSNGAASGTGACAANTYVSTLNSDAAPTCTSAVVASIAPASNFATAISAAGALVYAQPSAANLSNGTTGNGAVVLANSPITTNVTINQAANGNTAITSSRFTDVAPTGNFLNFKSAAGASLFAVDATGNVKLNGNTITAAAGAATVTVPNVTGTLLSNGNAAGTTLTISAAVAASMFQGTCTGPDFAGFGIGPDPTVNVANAATTMAVVISPQGPLAAGWDNFVWVGYVKSAGVVAIHICAAGTPAGTAPQTFNIRLIN